jgi:hypothetical protein
MNLKTKISINVNFALFIDRSVSCNPPDEFTADGYLAILFGQTKVPMFIRSIKTTASL